MNADAQHLKRVRSEQEKRRRHLYGDKGARFSSRILKAGSNGIMGAITTVTDKDNLVIEMSIEELQKEAKKKSKALGFRPHKPSQRSLNMRPKGKGWQFVMTEDGRLAWIRLRKLTPRECFRLMDVDEDKIERLLTSGISDSQLYKMAGNSIVVACMEGIFLNLFSEQETEQQLTLF